MARAAPTLPVSPRLFRHFAVITVAITACVAMFADGEGREAIAAQIKERQHKNDLMIAEAEKVGRKTIGLTKLDAKKGIVAAANASVEEADSGDEFGAPMDTQAGFSDSATSSGPPSAMSRMIGPGAMPGIPPFAQQRGLGGKQPFRPSPAQQQQIMEESRMRSGARE